MNKKLFAMLLMLALCVLGLTLTASAAEVTSGTCGAVGNENNVMWSYDAGTLTISGSGAMADYNDS